MSPDTSTKTSTRRKTLERSWVIGVVVFVLVRFLLAYSALPRYGMVVVVFGALDLVTAVPYAIGTARLAACLVDHEHQAAARWGVLASACFLAPYLWLAWAGRTRSFPAYVYIVLVLMVVCLGANALLSIRRRVRRDRVQGPLAEAPA